MRSISSFTDDVKAAAQGSWVSILSHMLGVTSEQLDPKRHGPCPRCGGEDRFRALDDVAETGGLLCNQCFNKKNGDGFAAIMWMSGCSFPEAVGKVADHLGIKKPAKSKKADPEKDLDFDEWNEELAGWLEFSKPGITTESLKANGARLAMYKRTYRVLALPIIGSDLDVTKPVGWVAIDFRGNSLPVWNKNGEIIDRVKVKMTAGSKPGFVGTQAIQRIGMDGRVDFVWKVEGVTDMLALYASIPEDLRDRIAVITNANGTIEGPKWMGSILAKHDVAIVHDADDPGQAGAKKWAEEIKLLQDDDKEVRNVTLPFEVQPKSGKDIRDYLQANKYADLQILHEKTTPCMKIRNPDGTIDYEKVGTTMEEEVLKILQMEVVFENEAGHIRVFSTLLRKSSTIKQISRLTDVELIQMLGPPARLHIAKEANLLGNVYNIEYVRKAIATIACTRRCQNDEKGVGVWPGQDEHGNETDTIVLVNNTEAARWNGDSILRKILAPRCEGLLLDFGSAHENWFDFDLLEANLKLAETDQEWVEAAIKQAIDFFGKWHWKNEEINPELDPTVMTGLVLATWVQTIFAWRPLVSVVGESNSGKSYLFQALGGSDHQIGLFGKLAFSTSRSTEAGIRQHVGNTGQVILCDEFEQSKARDRIFEMLRTSTRGSTLARGTADGRGTDYRLQHIAWVAAIETGLHRQPDQNRFIQLELLTAKKGKEGQLVLPDGLELYHLGQKLLAIAVSRATEARRLALSLKGMQVSGVGGRIVESYAVPAAMLAASLRMEDAAAEELLRNILNGAERDEEVEADHFEVLSAILSSTVILPAPTGRRSVSQIISRPVGRIFDHDGGEQALEASGIRLFPVSGDLFICHKQVRTGLLRGTPWEEQKIDTLLMRIKGAKRGRQRVGGRPSRGIWLPAEKLGFDEGTSADRDSFPKGDAFGSF